MNDTIIDDVQSCLTVERDDRTHQIVNVEFLLKRHPPEAVVAFLSELRNDYKRQLRNLLKRDITHPRINEVVARCFRIKMAINRIRNCRKGAKAA